MQYSHRELQKLKYKEIEARRTYVATIPRIGAVIGFKFGKKNHNGKVSRTVKGNNCFEVVSNGTTFLVDTVLGNYTALNIVK